LENPDKIRAGLINNQQISWTNLLVTPYQRDTCNTTLFSNTVEMTNIDGDSLSNTLLSTNPNFLSFTNTAG
jgi:hypothetical protein